MINYGPPPPPHCPRNRFFSLFSAGLLLAGTAHAQVGLRAGGTWMDQSSAPGGQLVGAGSANTHSQLGYHVGVSCLLPLTKRISLVPEVQFSRERQQVSTTSPFSPVFSYRSDYHLALSYLNVPILASLALGRFYLEAGPQFSLLLGGHGEGTASGYSQDTGAHSELIDQAATDRYRRVDAGLCLGLGVKLPLGLGLNVRAYQGLVKFNRDYVPQALAIPYTAGREYRQVLQAALTYQLPKLKRP